MPYTVKEIRPPSLTRQFVWNGAAGAASVAAAPLHALNHLVEAALSQLPDTAKIIGTLPSKIEKSAIKEGLTPSQAGIKVGKQITSVTKTLYPKAQERALKQAF